MNRRLLMLCAPLALAACSASLLPQQKYTPTIDWPLDPVPPAQNPPNPAGPVLLIRAITAAPGLDQQGIQSLLPNGSLNIDVYNLWAVAPADAVTQSLVDWCEASGAFSAVITPGSRLNAGLILEGELTELVAEGTAGQARAVLTLVVIKNGHPAIPLAQSRLTGSAPLSGTTPAAQVAAQRAALISVLQQSVALIKQFSN
jgi:ABC-type uncharacterized transport system auxiliary subunit